MKIIRHLDDHVERISTSRICQLLCKPLYHLLITVTIISLAESVVMLLLLNLPEVTVFQMALIDGVALAVITLPLLYIILLRPYINKRQTAEKKLHESESMYRSLVETTDDSIYLVDKSCRYLFMNNNHLSRMGFSGDEYLGHTYSEFHSKYDTAMFHENVKKVPSSGTSLQCEHQSGQDGRCFLQTLSPVTDSKGDTVAVTVISKEITALKIMEKKLHIISLTDELTGLYNRRGFFELAEHHLKLARRRKKELFMMYADLDNLKVVNDTYGHSEGDKALVDTANILTSTYRECDIIARIGGDEFVVFPIKSSYDQIDAIVSRLQYSIEAHNRRENRNYDISISVGMSLYDPSSRQTAGDLLVQADMLMYEHKRHKRKGTH